MKKIGRNSTQSVRTEIGKRSASTTDLKMKAIASHYHGLPEEDQESIAEAMIRLMVLPNMGAMQALETVYAIGLEWNGKTNSNRTIKNTKGR
jgi:hypothetical protein